MERWGTSEIIFRIYFWLHFKKIQKNKYNNRSSTNKISKFNI